MFRSHRKKRKKKETQECKTEEIENNKMTDISPNIAIIILGISIPSKI